jgi:hypothetical protein
MAGTMGGRFGASFSDEPDFVTKCVGASGRHIRLQHFRELTRGLPYIRGMFTGSRPLLDSCPQRRTS